MGDYAFLEGGGRRFQKSSSSLDGVVRCDCSGQYFLWRRSERSAKKIHRLILLGGVLAIPGLLKNRPEDARRLLLAFVCGTTALAIWDVIRIPTTWIYDLQHLDPAMAKLHGHTLEEHKWFLLYDKGNMRDPQFYTFTLLVLFTFFPVYQKLYRKPMMALIALNFTALLLHNKRGAWLALIAGVGLGVLLSRPALGFLKSRKGVAMILLGVLLFGGYSANRWEDIRDEFDPDHGGRLELWSRVFIPFMKDHPWGVGYRALKYEDLQEYTTDLSFTVKNHFHNNGLQIAAELGWLGLIAWAFWMLSHMFMLFRCRTRGLLQRAHADRIAHACLPRLLLCSAMVWLNTILVTANLLCSLCLLWAYPYGSGGNGLCSRRLELFGMGHRP